MRNVEELKMQKRSRGHGGREASFCMAKGGVGMLTRKRKNGVKKEKRRKLESSGRGNKATHEKRNRGSLKAGRRKKKDVESSSREVGGRVRGKGPDKKNKLQGRGGGKNLL